MNLGSKMAKSVIHLLKLKTEKERLNHQGVLIFSFNFLNSIRYILLDWRFYSTLFIFMIEVFGAPVFFLVIIYFILVAGM